MERNFIFQYSSCKSLKVHSLIVWSLCSALKLSIPVARTVQPWALSSVSETQWGMVNQMTAPTPHWIPSSKKVLFTDGAHYRNSQLGKMTMECPSANWCMFNPNLAPKAQSPAQKLGRKDFKYQRTRTLLWDVSSMHTRKLCSWILTTWSSKQDQHNDNEWVCQCRWRNSHKAPSLDEELYAINGCEKRENQSSPGTIPY